MEAGVSGRPYHGLAVTLFDTSARFYFDSGATSHMCGDKTKFNSFCELKEPVRIYVAKGKEYMNATAKGNIGILKNVFYVPSISKSLISIGALDKDGHGTLFQDGQVFIREKGSESFSLIGASDGSLYHDTPEFNRWIEGDMEQEFAGAVIENISDTDLWHGRLCHCSYDAVKRMAKSAAVTGMSVKDNSLKYDHRCDA